MALNLCLYASRSLEKIMSKWLKRRPVLESLLFSAIQWLNPARAKKTKKGLRRMKLIYHGAPDFPVLFIPSSSIFLHFPFVLPFETLQLIFFFLIQYSGVGYLRFRLYDQCWIFLIKSTIFIWAPKVLNCFFVILRNVMFFIFAHNLLVNAEGRFSRQSLYLIMSGKKM